MNRTHVARKIASTAASLLVAGAAMLATAPSASALSGYHDGFRNSRDSVTLDVGVNYVGLRSIDVKVVVTDKPGDAYCTQAVVNLWAAYDGTTGRQLGNDIVIGSVCNGQTAAFPLKTISTQAGDIDHVMIHAKRGSGGPTVTNDVCNRNRDGGYMLGEWHYDNCR